MSPIDWRKLYAANRAVIEGRGTWPGGEPGAPAAAPGADGPRSSDVALLGPEPRAIGVPATKVPAFRIPALDFGPLDLPPLDSLPLDSLPIDLPPLDLPLGLPPLDVPATGVPNARLRAVALREAPPSAPGGALEQIRIGQRAVFIYTPPDLDAGVPAPLVIALHGCTQTAATFSAGALLNRAADRHGFVVAYPEQSRDANPQCCWNWFTGAHQMRGAGEPASIAAAARALVGDRGRQAIDPAQVFVTGMSAGGAMATIMAATYPDLFRAVAIHSGLAYGCARNLPGATSAMRSGAPDPAALGRAAFTAMGAHARAVPALVIHGTADQIVSPVNGEHAAERHLHGER